MIDKIQVQNIIAKKVLQVGILSSLFSFFISLALNVIYALPEQPTRFLPLVSYIIILTAIIILYHKKRYIAGANLICICILIMALVGMFLNGGIFAPVFLLFFPGVALAAWLNGVTYTITYSLVAITFGVVCNILQAKDVLPPVPNVDPWYYLISIFIMLLLQSCFALVPSRTLHNSLKESELRRQTITQRENQLHGLQDYLASIINFMPSMLIGVDVEGKVTQWNLKAEQVSTIRSQEAVGQPLETVLPYMAGEVKLLQKELRIQEVYKEFKQVRTEDGEERYVDITAYPLIASGVEETIIRIDDVTERVKLEQMMVQTEKMMSLGGVAAGMAHEINNPLAGMMGNAQTIETRVFGDIEKNNAIARECGVSLEIIQKYMTIRGVPRMIEAILDSGRRAASIVSNILNFSRKSVKGVQPFNLVELLDSTLELAASDYDLKKKFDFRSIEIIREYDPNLPNVLCYGDEVQQVFFNLFRNGAEAMRDKEYVDDRPRLILRINQQDDMAMVEVEDNGPGMDEETCKRIFEPFFTTKEGNQGTGLGLSVSYFIVTDQHKGKMEVESVPGEWTRFTVVLPIKDWEKEHPESDTDRA